VDKADFTIKFHCENCGQKISVPQIHAGKKGKCPKCKHPVVVPKQAEHASPDKSSRLVSFARSMCDKEIKVPESSRGKLIECPHCGCYVEVPSEKTPTLESKSAIKPGPEDDVFDMSLEERQKLDGEIRVDETEQAEERKLPWLVDIFLYPTSASGMIHIAIFLIVPILIGLLSRFVFSYARHYGGILSLILYVLLIGYMFFYFGECIRDSAAGGLRAPETLANAPGTSDLFEQYVCLFACYAFFFGPATFYRSYIYFSNTQMNSAIFWPLLAYGVFFFPMGILAVVMFGSVNGLNPILLIGSIASTFFQYCGLVIFFSGLYALFILSIILPFRYRWGILPKVISNIVLIWLLLVAGHLIGCFYRRYQKKLNWEV